MFGKNVRRALYLGSAASLVATGVEAIFPGTSPSSNFLGTPFPDPFQFFLGPNSFPVPSNIADPFGLLSRSAPSDMFRALTDNFMMATAMPEQFLRAAADAATLLTMQQREHTQGGEHTADAPSASPSASSPSISSPSAPSPSASSPSRGFFIPGMPFYPANWMPIKSMFPLAQNPNDWFNNFLLILWAANHPVETAYYVKLAKNSKYPVSNQSDSGSVSHSSSSESASYEGRYPREYKTPKVSAH